jgi:hypothetical protein
MNRKVSKKSILWVIWAIAIGIASNAIWDFLVKPLLLFTQYTVLTFTTLGTQQFKNEIYIEIAKGDQDPASHFLLGLALAMVGILTLVIIAFLLNSLTEIKERIRGLSSEIKTIEGNAIEADLPNIAPPKSRLARLERRYQRRVTDTTVAGPFFALIIVTIFTLGARAEYIISAGLHFEQLIAISAPYLPDRKEMQLVSEFAQIKNRNDYERIILELRSVAEKNGQSVPKFDIW